LYATGQGVPKSELQGMSWFRKAAEQGNVQAQFNMGLEYMRMRGSPRTRLSACFWLMLAKAHGVNAAELLGFAQMLENQLSDDERADALAEVRNWKPSSNR
jgi:TPR repeat protein